MSFGRWPETDHHRETHPVKRVFGRARPTVIDFSVMITWELATILILVAYILGLMTAIRLLKA